MKKKVIYVDFKSASKKSKRSPRKPDNHKENCIRMIFKKLKIILCKLFDKSSKEIESYDHSHLL